MPTPVLFALKSLLGLVCDPVAGLVEVPCVKRNVIGAVNAITSCDMAMAGIESAIPVDEVIDAMKAVGDTMPCSLRETGEVVWQQLLQVKIRRKFTKIIN